MLEKSIYLSIPSVSFDHFNLVQAIPLSNIKVLAVSNQNVTLLKIITHDGYSFF